MLLEIKTFFMTLHFVLKTANKLIKVMQISLKWVMNLYEILNVSYNFANHLLSLFANRMASVSGFASSSAKSAAVFHTHALSLPLLGFNAIFV